MDNLYDAIVAPWLKRAVYSFCANNESNKRIGKVFPKPLLRFSKYSCRKAWSWCQPARTLDNFAFMFLYPIISLLMLQYLWLLMPDFPVYFLRPFHSLSCWINWVLIGRALLHGAVYLWQPNYMGNGYHLILKQNQLVLICKTCFDHSCCWASITRLSYERRCE